MSINELESKCRELRQLQALIDEAVANARQSDLIVAVVGDVVQLVGETCSTATLELLGEKLPKGTAGRLLRCGGALLVLRWLG